ncbi:MAG: SdrD B-like domain-containing protein [Phycisphaeraceae bacterium]
MRNHRQLNRASRRRTLGYSDSQLTAALEALESRLMMSTTVLLDLDGPGGDAPVANVLSMDWAPANTLAVGLNKAIADKISSGTNITVDDRGTPGDTSDDFVILGAGGTSDPVSLLYQAKLQTLVLGGGGTSSPPGLNTSYEVTVAARFDVQISLMFHDGQTGQTSISFQHAGSADEYFEIYSGSGADFNANDLTGTGFNDGTLILKANVKDVGFSASLVELPGSIEDLDKAATNNYPGLKTVIAAGSQVFQGDVSFSNDDYFLNTINVINFVESTNGNTNLPFEQAEPSARFLVNSAGTAVGEAAVLAGAGDPTHPLFGIGTVNGSQTGLGGASIQLQNDSNTSFDFEPAQATAMLGNIVWHDTDADGEQDNLNQPGGEQGIAGVTVKLLTAGGDGIFETGDDAIEQVLLTGDGTNTDYDNDGNADPLGFYKFNGLTPGVQYKVMFNNPDVFDATTNPDGYMFSPRQAAGVTPDLDSDGPMSDIVVLADGEYNDTIDAGLFRKGSIHVFGFEDKDADGTYEPGQGDVPFEGKVIELVNEAGVVIDTQVTDATGQAWFTGLFPGTYKVRENVVVTSANTGAMPSPGTGGMNADGTMFTIERTVVITSGIERAWDEGAAMLPAGDERTEVVNDPDGSGVDEDLMFGNFFKACLGDRVWLDLDADGNQDKDGNGVFTEPGINGVTVKLLADLDNNGSFETLIDTTLTSTLLDADGDGNLDAGTYKFTGLTPGVKYAVMFNNPDDFDATTNPDGYMFSMRQAAGTMANMDSDGPMSDLVVLTSGEFNQTIDAGLFRKGSIHVFGFEDKDADGTYEPGQGDVPFEGKVIELVNEAGVVIDTQVTDATGQAWFTGLFPGTYKVRENVVVTSANTGAMPSPGTGGMNADGTMFTIERTVVITSGIERAWDEGAAMLPAGDERTEVVNDPDGSGVDEDLMFGNFFKGSIHVFGYEDMDADGEYEPGDGDVPFEGKIIELLDSNGTLIDTQVTDATGQAWFLNLIPGTYTVRENVVQTSANTGSMPSPGTGAMDGMGGMIAIERTVVIESREEAVWEPGAAMLPTGDPRVETFTDGSDNDNVDENLTFGNFYKGSIHAFGYIDEDADGIYEPNEGDFAFEGKSIVLLDSNGVEIGREVTDVNGEVWYLNLAPGTYQLYEDLAVLPSGITPSPGEERIRTVVIRSREEAVWEPGAAMLPMNDPRHETFDDGTVVNGFDENLTFGNTMRDVEIELKKYVKPALEANFGIDIEKYVVPTPPDINLGDCLCCIHGKPVILTFAYTGGGPDATMTSQAAGKFSVNGDPNDDPQVFIRVSSSSSATDSKAKVFFSGSVDLGAEFDANATGLGFGAFTYFHIFDSQGGTLLQTVAYHTSCSTPIVMGDVIGGITLTGFLGEDGIQVSLPQPSDELGEDADLPNGPAFALGDLIKFNYVLTNTVAGTQLLITDLIDDATTPDDMSDDFTPTAMVGMDGFNVGDSDKDGRVDFGEEWRFMSTMTPAIPGAYRNKIKVIADAVDDSNTVIATGVMDMDPAHFTVATPGVEGDLCVELGKPLALTFLYDGVGTTANTAQSPDKGKVVTNNANSQNDPQVFIVVSNNTNPADNKAKKFFSGAVDINTTFTASIANANTDKFDANTYIHIFASQGGALLQTLQYHTSCSQPIQLGDELGTVELVGYNGMNGNATAYNGPIAVLPPDNGGGNGGSGGMMVFDPNNIGLDADTPGSGPTVGLGEDLMFTYLVTTPTVGAQISIDELLDDNASPLNLGDDFMPQQVLVNGFNLGDTDMDGLLEFGETWYFTAVKNAGNTTGEFKNFAKVKGTDTTTNTMVMDDDCAHYKIEANPDIDIQKYVSPEPSSMEGVMLCQEIGKPAATTWLYSGFGNGMMTMQDSGKAGVIAGGDPNGLATVRITNSVNSDVQIVNIGESFTIAGSYGADFVMTISDLSGNLVQRVHYHTSCSQPIMLGDVVGSLELVGYLGTNGMSAEAAPADPFENLGEDADSPTGPEIALGANAIFKYVVTNTGDVDLMNVVVTDDNETPGDTSDDFNPDAVLNDNGFNIGDLDEDGTLDVGEKWLFTAIRPVVSIGLHKNDSKAVAVDADGTMVMDTDPAHYTAVDPFAGQDLCMVLGKPTELTFRYEGVGTTVITSQDAGKSTATGNANNDPQVFVIVSDKSNPTDSKAKTYFTGNVNVGDNFTAKVSTANTDKFSANTYVFIYDSQNGTLLQTLTYHTSCSQPLKLGDQIGSIELVGYTGQNGQTGASSIAPVAPAQAPAPALADVSASLSIKDKIAKVTLTNDGTSAITIQSLLAAWTTSDGKLKDLHRIKINGVEIFHDHIDGSPITIDSFNNAAALTIAAGQTITIEFEMEKGTKLSDFDLSIDFGGGLQTIV